MFLILQIFTDGFIAGGTAGVVVETALYPIDTIKTRLQAGELFEIILMHQKMKMESYPFYQLQY